MPIGAMKEVLLDHVRDDLSIRFRRKTVALIGEFLLERDVVFNDAVVNDDNFARAVPVGVCVLFCRTAMGGPARMADSVRAIERLQPNDFFQVAQLSLSATNLESVAIPANCDTGG